MYIELRICLGFSGSFWEFLGRLKYSADAQIFCLGLKILLRLEDSA
jgi:hypothetical protein